MGRVKYDEEQLKWIADNRYNYKNVEELRLAFNSKFEQTMTLSYLRELVVKLGVRRDIKKYFENPHGKWLRENIDNYKGFKKLAEAFNKEFNFSINAKQLQKITIKFNVERKEGRKAKTVFTEEQLKWAKENYKNFNSEFIFDKKGFIKAFEEEFDFAYPGGKNGIYNLLVNKLGIKEVIHDMSDVTYAVGKEMYPIGYECKQHDVWLVKIKEEKNPNNIKRFNYRPKAHILYEQYHNVVINDKTHLVIHLDKNKDNFDKDNLMLISRKSIFTMNQNWYSSEDVDFRRTMFTYAELKNALKELKEEK